MGQSSSKGSLAWDREPFAEGATRWAFKAKVANGMYEGYPSGTELVLKVIKKDCYERGIRITPDDIKAQDLTRRYCDRFNRKKYTNKNVFSRSGKLITASENYYGAKRALKINKGETTLLEQYIHGEYEKFNSNNGWSDDSKMLPNFFSHWTWVESHGEHLVCDLQGHRGRPGGPPYGETHDYYLFTDPVVMTNGPGLRFGCSDLGHEGQLRWFAKHKCNKLCETHGLKNKLPKQPLPDYDGSDEKLKMTIRIPVELGRKSDKNDWSDLASLDKTKLETKMRHTCHL